MKISVVGAGSWGTAIVSILSKNNHVNWWVRRERLKNQILLKKRNTKYLTNCCLLYTSPSPRDVEESRMPSSA